MSRILFTQDGLWQRHKGDQRCSEGKHCPRFSRSHNDTCSFVCANIENSKKAKRVRVPAGEQLTALSRFSRQKTQCAWQMCQSDSKEYEHRQKKFHEREVAEVIYIYVSALRGWIAFHAFWLKMGWIRNCTISFLTDVPGSDVAGHHTHIHTNTNTLSSLLLRWCDSWKHFKAAFFWQSFYKYNLLVGRKVETLCFKCDFLKAVVHQ